MPSNLVKTKKDEKLWERAKKQAEKAGHKDDWPYVNSIYQNMKGKKGGLKSVLTRLAVPLASPSVWERRADSISAKIGGTARVWGPENLLIEDAGVGINLYFKFGGSVLEMQAGSAHPEDLGRWVADQIKPGMNVEYEDLGKSPDRFARVYCRLLEIKGIQCRAETFKVIVAGGPEQVLEVVSHAFDEKTAKMIAQYFEGGEQ